PVFQGAHVYDLNLRDGFVLKGAISHYTETDMQKAGGYFYGKDVDRIIRIGDALYTISAWGVKSHTEEEVEKLGSLSFVDISPVGEETCPDESQAGVKYISKDPDQCALVRFSCVEGTEAFSLSCGCGCKPAN
ncbi:MAG TPA: beta-propeller domain-containing protein, partial [Candidatus Peribacterales bacterium]|nr:beta-propeller domain-containing protein [Candidatus Peribacterales bacterium]